MQYCAFGARQGLPPLPVTKHARVSISDSECPSRPLPKTLKEKLSSTLHCFRIKLISWSMGFSNQSNWEFLMNPACHMEYGVSMEYDGAVKWRRATSHAFDADFVPNEITSAAEYFDPNQLTETGDCLARWLLFPSISSCKLPLWVVSTIKCGNTLGTIHQNHFSILFFCLFSPISTSCCKSNIHDMVATVMRI